MKNTNLFIVINLRTLNSVKAAGGKPAKFRSREQAEESANKRCLKGQIEIWTVVPVKFTHDWIQHSAPLIY